MLSLDQPCPANRIVCFSRPTGSAADVVEGKLGDAGVELEKEREGLANATCGTKNSDLGQLSSGKGACQ
jgi:hypothetical protein